MSTQIGKGHIHSLSAATLGTGLVGYVSPNLQTLRVSHSETVDNIRGQTGKVTGSIAEDPAIECTFDLIPEGTTVPFAKKSAGQPSANTAFYISGLPIIALGPFVDALNTDGQSLPPWIYQGGGSINGPADGKWTATLPLKRFPEIVSDTPPGP